ncbi:FHA domain-containing protein [Mucilaginibacter sp.]|uniref:FHA domain-containing protein n=1 Tax=Mucilaginibacter sp. TaxID=1882438 RepID=UPI00283D03A8|nr:FHA domain-containing protein [Mucilaginibacter sp.]MDR3696100.1 FHA domain-containing protein [Mucilaginibacter sp.]
MFDLFKKNENNGPKDVKAVRDTLLRFIKQEFQKAEGGEGRNIKGINIFIGCNGTEKHIYEAAVYTEEPDRFKNEIQRIADDYALDIPEGWEMDVDFVDECPPEASKIDSLNAAIFIRTKENTIQRSAIGYLRVLNGESEKQKYQIKSSEGKINIGRGKNVQVEDGFFRLNQIAFDAESVNRSNKYVSRQHAHIEWNKDNGCFMLFADEGGVPPRNKIKVRSALIENLVKLHSVSIGHKLAEGDQVILGESAVLEFSYRSEENKNG